MVQDIDTGSQGPDLWNLVLLWTFDVKSDSQPDDEYRVSAHAADHIVWEDKPLHSIQKIFPKRFKISLSIEWVRIGVIRVSS